MIARMPDDPGCPYLERAEEAIRGGRDPLQVWRETAITLSRELAETADVLGYALDFPGQGRSVESYEASAWIANAALVVGIVIVIGGVLWALLT